MAACWSPWSGPPDPPLSCRFQGGAEIGGSTRARRHGSPPASLRQALHPVVEHGDPIGDRHHHAHVVLDQQDGDAALRRAPGSIKPPGLRLGGFMPAAGSSRAAAADRSPARGRSPAAADRRKAGCGRSCRAARGGRRRRGARRRRHRAPPPRAGSRAVRAPPPTPSPSLCDVRPTSTLSMRRHVAEQADILVGAGDAVPRRHGRASTRRCARRHHDLAVVGGTNDVRQLKIVVLPAPFGPISAWIAPSCHRRARHRLWRAGRRSAWSRSRQQPGHERFSRPGHGSDTSRALTRAEAVGRPQALGRGTPEAPSRRTDSGTRRTRGAVPAGRSARARRRTTPGRLPRPPITRIGKQVDRDQQLEGVRVDRAQHRTAKTAPASPAKAAPIV